MFLSCFPLPKKPGKTETAVFFGCSLCISGFSWEKTAVKSSHAVIKIVSFMECWGGPALGGNQLCCRKDLRSWGYVWCPQLCCWGWFPLTIFWRGWGWEVEGIVATHGSLLGDSFATFIIGSTLQTFQRKMIHHSTCMKWVYLILHWYCYCFCWVCAMYETHFNLWLVGSSNIRGDMWWHGDALRFTPITDAGTLKIEASSQDSCLDEAVLWCSARKNKQLSIRHLEATSWLLRIFSWFFFNFLTSSFFFKAIWLIKILLDRFFGPAASV